MIQEIVTFFFLQICPRFFPKLRDGHPPVEPRELGVRGLRVFRVYQTIELRSLLFFISCVFSCASIRSEFSSSSSCGLFAELRILSSNVLSLRLLPSFPSLPPCVGVLLRGAWRDCLALVLFLFSSSGRGGRWESKWDGREAEK